MTWSTGPGAFPTAPATRRLLRVKKGELVAGGYRLGDRLGAGATGEVYAAVDTDGTPAALKLLHPHLADRPDVRRRFAREARCTARIVSPFVARVLGAGDDGERVWIASERLFGETLEARLARERALGIGVTNDIVVQVLQGLADAHAAEVVHRDVKPSNIFLEAVPGPAKSRVRILDFGLSKVRSRQDGASETPLTSVLDSLGTATYMPPEQFGDAGSADERADLYAAACVVYRMLTGTRPFPARSHHVLLQQKLCVPPRSLHDVTGVRWPDAADAYFACALAADREDRFASAQAMLQAWRNLVRGRSFPDPRTFDRAVILAIDQETSPHRDAGEGSTTGARPW